MHLTMEVEDQMYPCELFVPARIVLNGHCTCRCDDNADKTIMQKTPFTTLTTFA